MVNGSTIVHPCLASSRSVSETGHTHHCMRDDRDHVGRHVCVHCGREFTVTGRHVDPEPTVEVDPRRVPFLGGATVNAALSPRDVMDRTSIEKQDVSWLPPFKRRGRRGQPAAKPATFEPGRAPLALPAGPASEQPAYPGRKVQWLEDQVTQLWQEISKLKAGQQFAAHVVDGRQLEARRRVAEMISRYASAPGGGLSVQAVMALRADLLDVLKLLGGD